MSHSTKSSGPGWLGLVVLVLATAACGPSRVQVEGEFPAPLVQPLPITLGVWLSDDFKQHEFSDEGKVKGNSGWVVNTGEAQTKMWTALLAGMFESIVWLEEEPTTENTVPNVDGILIPAVQELQYAIPTHTNVKIYEIWMRYRFLLVSPNGDGIAQWSMSSYGKTPTAFMQSDEGAVNLAAVMALRDAGANFSTNFTETPALKAWLQQYLPTAEVDEE